VVFPTGTLLPFGSGMLPQQSSAAPGQIAISGSDVRTTIDVAFAGQSAPFGLLPWADTQLAERGPGTPIFFPNFLADLNHNGVIDDSDKLFVGVNASRWIESPLSASVLPDGTIVSITNGSSASLPGYVFSTTPLVFNSKFGLVGTPPGTDVFAVGSHSSVAGAPEPPTVALLGLGLIAMLGFARNRLRM